MKVNLLPAQPGLAGRIYNRAKAVAPKICRAALMILPAVFGMPVAMVIENPSPISLERMAALKARAKAAVAHLKPAVASLTEREKILRLQTDRALFDLEELVLKFGRAIGADKDQAELLLSRVKHYEIPYLAAADIHLQFLMGNQILLKEKLLLRAEAELHWIEIAEAHPQTFKARLTGEIDLKKIELQTLEEQLTQMDDALNFIRAQIDQACDAERITSGQMSLEDISDLLNLKLGWFRMQLSTLDFRRGRVMPLREQVLALETLLFSLFSSETEAGLN